MDFTGRVIVVTGSSMGIGLAAARRFAELGGSVIIADIDEKHGINAEKNINSEGGKAVFVKTDVGDINSVRAMVDTTQKEYGRLDILVNNAGIYTKGDVLTATEDDWDRLMRVNLKGAFLCMKLCVPKMIETAQGGVVVNVASEAGLVGIAGQVVYNVSKAGVILLTKSSAVDLADKGIRCNCICPGTTETLLVAASISRAPDPAAARHALESCRPLNRLGKVEEIAHGIVFLASREAGYATGAVLSIDGGYTSQ